MINISEEKLTRINKVLSKFEFKDVDSFVDHAVELLLFAEENKDKFNKIIRS